jgi:hypothetical protein
MVDTHSRPGWFQEGSDIIAFLLAAFVIGWFVGRLRERRRGQRGEE